MNKSFKTLFTLFLGILLIIPTFTANSVESLGEQLIKLEGLYDRGAITKEEFTKAKAILLNGSSHAYIKHYIEVNHLGFIQEIYGKI